jgi:Zn-dependent peptidase ImmA (M78 family)/DNA-binding XRE family transcriptional regulator
MRMTDAAIPSNLRRLRLHKNLSQAALAAQAGITTLAYRNIESGKSNPKANTLQALANAVEVSIHDLVKPTTELRRVRFRSLKQRLNTRTQVLTQVSDWLSNFNELEKLLGESRQVTLKEVSIGKRKDKRERGIEAASALRRYFGLREEESVRDICGLLESKGIKLFPMVVASDGIFGLSVAEGDGGPAVAVNTWERISVERWIFTAVHELAHLVLHLNSFDVNQTQEEDEQEIEANICSSHFLMPEHLFKKEWDETYGLPLVYRVLKVKRMFRVSNKSVLYRVSEKAGKQIWYQFNREYSQRFNQTLLKADEPNPLKKTEAWRSSPEGSRAGEPDNLSPSDFKEDRLWCLVRRAYEQDLISLPKAAEILNIPLDEMRSHVQPSWV